MQSQLLLSIKGDIMTDYTMLMSTVNEYTPRSSNISPENRLIIDCARECSDCVWHDDVEGTE